MPLLGSNIQVCSSNIEDLMLDRNQTKAALENTFIVAQFTIVS